MMSATPRLNTYAASPWHDPCAPARFADANAGRLVLQMPDSYEEPSDEELRRLETRFARFVTENRPMVLPPGYVVKRV